MNRILRRKLLFFFLIDHVLPIRCAANRSRAFRQSKRFPASHHFASANLSLHQRITASLLHCDLRHHLMLLVVVVVVLLPSMCRFFLRMIYGPDG